MRVTRVGGETWRRYRDALGERGFTFEYSATFGQALTAARKDELTVEYGEAIVFDYSYRYFHGDGYGKDFRVLNSWMRRPKRRRRRFYSATYCRSTNSNVCSPRTLKNCGLITWNGRCGSLWVAQ